MENKNENHDNKSLTTEGKQDDDQSEVSHKAGTLFVAPIEHYVDDNELYPQKYSDFSRIKYWEFLLDHPRPPKLPHDHISWVVQGGNSNFAEEIMNYPRSDKIILATTVHIFWDYLYIYLFGIWILLTTAYFDELVRVYILVPEYLLYLPLVLMLIAQLIPVIGVIYLVTKCNDLTKLVASRTFGYWAFCAVMMGQYIEYTYYSGHKREEKAGKSRLEWYEDWDHLDLEGNPTHVLRSKPGIITKLMKMIRRDSKILPNKQQQQQQQLIEEENKESENEEDDNRNDNDNDSNKGEEKLYSHRSGKDGEDSTSVRSGVGGDIPLGLEGGYLQRMKEEAEAAEKAEKQRKIEEIARKEALVTDWHEWKCLVCGKKNRRPRHPLDLTFHPTYSEKGVYLKRIYTKLIPDKDIPTCKHCLTLANYKPRLCTAHIFPYYPKPYEAFENYPEAVPHIPRSRLSTFIDKTTSCLFGQRNHPDSRLMVNDWRISMYLSSRFPLVPRPTKSPSDLYEVGEIVECKKQKMDWSRARIVESRPSHIYDIIYDTGDEVRMLPEEELRLPPSKGLYSYRIELCLVLLILLIPVSLMGTIYMKFPGMVLFPTLIICGILLMFRVLEFIDSFSEFYAAGCCLIFQQHLLLCYPLIVIFIVSIFCLLFSILAIPCVVIAVMIIIGLFSSLPVIYIKRPTFAVMCVILFLQFSISFLLVAIRIDGHGKSFIPWVMIDSFPALTSVYSLLRFRRWLGFIWDVSLQIRPVEYSDYEVSYPRQFYNWIKEQINELMQLNSPPPLNISSIEQNSLPNEQQSVEKEPIPSLEMAAISANKTIQQQHENEDDDEEV